METFIALVYDDHYKKLWIAYMTRLEWLLQKYSPSLSSRLKEDISKNRISSNEYDDDTFFLAFEEADPTRNNRYLKWIIDKYLTYAYQFEDLYKVKEYLQHFDSNKHFLSVDQRDINRYKNLPELWQSIKPLVENSEDYKSRNQIRDEEKEKAYAETIIVYQDENCNVFIPMTSFAAQFHGRGTQWCTSSENQSMFHSYHHQAPLIIFDMKDGNKFQLHLNGNLLNGQYNIQFMDETDANVCSSSLYPYSIYFDDLLKKIVLKITDDALHYMPEEIITEDFLLDFFSQEKKQSIFHIQGFFPHLLTEKVIQASLKNNPVNITILDPVHLKKEDYKQALKNDGLYLHAVPDNLKKDTELIQIAIHSNPFALRYLRPSQINKDILFLAHKINEERNFISPLNYRCFPFKMINDFLKENHLISSVLYSDYWNKQSVVETIRQYINFKPQNEHDEENNKAFFLKFLHKVPTSCFNSTAANEAVSFYGEAFPYIPEKFQTKNLLEIAINNNLTTIDQNTFKRLDTLQVSKDRYKELIKLNPDNFECIDERSPHYSPDLFMLAMQSGLQPKKKLHPILLNQEVLNHIEENYVDRIYGLIPHEFISEAMHETYKAQTHNTRQHIDTIENWDKNKIIPILEETYNCKIDYKKFLTREIETYKKWTPLI